MEADWKRQSNTGAYTCSRYEGCKMYVDVVSHCEFHASVRIAQPGCKWIDVGKFTSLHAAQRECEIRAEYEGVMCSLGPQ